MKRAKRGAKRIFVAMMAIVLAMENVSVPVKGEVKEGAETQAEMISEQTLSKSVEHDTEKSVSANFVSVDEIEVSANTVKKEEMKKEDEETDAEMTASVYSGIDGDLEWNIDSEGCLTVNGQGDFDGFPAWLGYGEKIKRGD